MGVRGLIAWVAVLIAGLATGVCHADEAHREGIRIGGHGSFGRLVFSVPDRTAVTWSRQGNQVIVISQALVDRAVEDERAPGIASASVLDGRLTVRVVPGVSLHIFRLSNRFVLDVVPKAFKASSLRQHADMPVVQTAAAPQATVLPGLPAPMVAVVDETGLPPPPPAALPQIPPQVGGRSEGSAPDPPAPGGSETLSIVASLVPTSAGHSSGLLVPCDDNVGAAAFVRVGRLEVVFDSQKPIDLSGVASDPTFGHARLVLLPTGAMLDLPCAGGCNMQLRRVADGWLLGPEQGGTHAINPQPVDEGLAFPVKGAGRVVIVTDPVGGGNILVGTVRKDGQGIELANKTPGFSLVPTLLGVVVERISDLIDLRLNSTGFLLVDPYQATGASRPDALAAFSRSIDLPAVETAEQWRRYKLALADAASRPPGARRAARLDASRAALALGFGRESRRLATIADADGPGGAEQAQSAFLEAAGAYQAGDADASALLSDARIGNSDEAVLWRSLALAREEPNNHVAAREIADRLGLLLGYPDGLRKAIAGDAALSLARGGDETVWTLVPRLGGDNGKVGLARALVAGRGHRDPAALGALNKLAADDDPQVALQAVQEAIETRLQGGMISPGEAAKLLGQHVYDGRMAGRELEVVMRVAALKSQAADWSGALSDLRIASQLFPDAMPAIRHAVGGIIQAISGASSSRSGAAAGETLNPITAAALLENYQDLLPADIDRAALSIGLASRLASLDLPDRAAQFLRQAIMQSQGGAERSRNELALSDLLLAGGDATGAQAALDDADRTGVPPERVRQRTILGARTLAAAGNSDGALAALASLQGRDVLNLRATLLAKQKNWQALVPVLQAILADQVPSGLHGKIALDAGGEDIVLKLAAALAQSGQKDALAQLNRDWATSFTDSVRRDTLALLAAPEVRSIGDLARSAADLASTRNALTVLERADALAQHQPPS